MEVPEKMFRKLMPKENKYFEYFERHTALIVTACQDWLAITANGGIPGAGVDRIRDLEHEADGVTRQCIEALHRTFVTPFDRTDIQRLIELMDDVLDGVEEAADRLVIYDLSVVWPEARRLVEILLESTVALSEAIRGLRDLRNAEPIQAACSSVHLLEKAADDVYRGALARLFREESDLILILKWKEIFEILESAVDCCEDMANIVTGVVIELT